MRMNHRAHQYLTFFNTSVFLLTKKYKWEESVTSTYLVLATANNIVQVYRRWQFCSCENLLENPLRAKNGRKHARHNTEHLELATERRGRSIANTKSTLTLLHTTCSIIIDVAFSSKLEFCRPEHFILLL